jgi:transcriptional regulator
MKENLGMNYHEIAAALNRDDRTIWASCKKADSKMSGKIGAFGKGINVPMKIFANRELTALEAIVVYLKGRGMKYSEIAEALGREQRNVWTIYNLASKKAGEKGIKKGESEAKMRKRKEEMMKDELYGAWKALIEEMTEAYSLSKEELVGIIAEEFEIKYELGEKEIRKITGAPDRENIPTTIFIGELGALEALCKYMKENLGMSYREIAGEISRNERTIWSSCDKANKKVREKIEAKETELQIPLSVIKDRKLTVLESIIVFLKRSGMRYNKIAEALGREQRNVWTIYHLALKKLKKSY